jgi:hypothetical protein
MAHSMGLPIGSRISRGCTHWAVSLDKQYMRTNSIMLQPPGDKSVMLRRIGAMALLLAGVAIVPPARAQAPQTDDTRPLSPAQVLLFETPHMQNLSHPETLAYAYTRDGPAGFTDTVTLHIRQVNPDGTKDVAFDYLTGPRRVAFPELNHFRGNPLLMVTLERDVTEMKDQLGLSASYFRNKIREGFVSAADVKPGTYLLNGKEVPAQVVTLRPFAGEERLERISQIQAKTYTFTLSDAVPGGIADIRIAMPADARMGAPAFEQRTTFQDVQP